MSDRRLAIYGLAGLGAAVIAAAVAIRVNSPDSELDTAAVFGFLTLIAVQIQKLGGGDDGGIS